MCAEICPFLNTSYCKEYSLNNLKLNVNCLYCIICVSAEHCELSSLNGIINGEKSLYIRVNKIFQMRFVAAERNFVPLTSRNDAKETISHHQNEKHLSNHV